MRRCTLKYSLVAALAASAMATSTAGARPIDRADRYASPTSSLAGTTEQQDLRGEHAQDAARLAAQAHVVEHGEQVRKESFLRRRAPARAATGKQDLRGEHAQDAARAIEPGTVSAQPPVYWAYDYEAPKPSPRVASAAAPKPNDDTDVWLILGIALGATGIVAGSLLAVSRRSRVRVPA